VVSDTFGVSSSIIIDELIRGELTIEEMAGLAKGRLTKKKAQIQEALVGKFREHHKFMIQSSLKHIKSIERVIASIDSQIDKTLSPYREEYKLLQTIPGVKEHAAASIIAEIGVDMERFPTEEHLSSWAGMSPGSNESAGKKKVVT
jgi:transposase